MGKLYIRKFVFMADLVGKKAPDFTLLDDEGNERNLADFKGKWVLLYFYPKDLTPGCTTEACTLRDKMNDLKKLDIQVLGVSADTVKSHAKFKMKEKLNFPLLADTEKQLINAYDVWKEKKFMGRKFMGIMRESFLIDKKGIVVKHYTNVKPPLHAAEVMGDVAGMS